MQYRLCSQISGYDGHRMIGRAQFEALQEARQVLLELSDVEEKYGIIIDNYFELELSLLEEALRSLVYPSFDSMEFQENRSLTSRRLMNLLTSVRLYLESLPHHADVLLKNDAAVCAAVKNAPAAAYDGSLEYRVMEALRNYSQHEALPVHSWTASCRMDRAVEPVLFRYEVKPGVNVLDLARGRKFKSAVLEELKQHARRGGVVEIKPLIRKYIELVGTVHGAFRQATAGVSSRSAELIVETVQTFAAEFPEVAGTPLVAIPCDEHGVQLGESLDISDWLDERLQQLRLKTGGTLNLSRRRVDY